MVSSTLCPAVHILGSQNVSCRAEGIADHYWPWAVFLYRLYLVIGRIGRIGGAARLVAFGLIRVEGGVGRVSIAVGRSDRRTDVRSGRRSRTGNAFGHLTVATVGNNCSPFLSCREEKICGRVKGGDSRQ